MGGDLVTRLPAAVYTPYAMATAGKTVAIPAFARQYGDLDPIRKVNPAAVSSFQVMTYTLPASVLPSDAPTPYTMATAGKTVGIGFGTGHAGHTYPIILSIDQVAAPTCMVAGNVALALAFTPLLSCMVTGAVSLALGAIKGVSTVLGTAACVGSIGVTFSPTSTNGCSVVGFVNARFLQRAGQQESCISGPDTPAAGKPSNAVH